MNSDPVRPPTRHRVPPSGVARAVTLAAIAFAVLAVPGQGAMAASCIESDDWLKPVIRPDSPDVTIRARNVLRDLVGSALAHSQNIGAARLLAEAASIEIDEARAGRLPRATLSSTIGYGSQSIEGVEERRGRSANTQLGVSIPLYDAGRIAETVNSRRQLAEAARLGEIDAQEQVALQTLTLALERSRHYKRGQVAQQQARRMACLVDSLERVVAADPGRRSELDQARKTLLEAELTRNRSESVKRQVEIRLQRFTGGPLPRLEGLTTVLGAPPDLDSVLDASSQSGAVRQLALQAEAAASIARARAADGKPRVNLALSGLHSSGITDSRSWLIGMNIEIPLYDATTRYSVEAANRRAEATRMQFADLSESRASRVTDVHDQALSLAHEMIEIEAILENSARLRQATLMQWSRLGKRSLFDVMTAERDHFALRLAQVDSLHDRQETHALLWSLGYGVRSWLGDGQTSPAVKE